MTAFAYFDPFLLVLFRKKILKHESQILRIIAQAIKRWRVISAWGPKKSPKTERETKKKLDPLAS
jgi:hypothetical protein